MIRLVKMGGKWYGLEIREIDSDEVDNLIAFVESGEPVLLCCDLEEAEELLDIDIDDVEMVT